LVAAQICEGPARNLEVRGIVIKFYEPVLRNGSSPLTVCKGEYLALARTRIGPFAFHLSEREFNRQKNSLGRPISINVDHGCREVIEAQPCPVRYRQTIDQREEVFGGLRADQPGAQNLSLAVSQERADLQTAVYFQGLVEQHNPGALSRRGISPGLLNQLRVLCFPQVTVDLGYARDAGDLDLLFLAIDSPPINEAAAKGVHANQRIALRKLDALGSEAFPEQADVLAFGLTQR
jgi:hypothetical protein